MNERLHLSPNQRAWRRFRRNRGAALALIVLLAVMALVLLWPLGRLASVAGVLPKAMTHAPETVSETTFAPPSWEHWFGTDAHGRDLLSRVCHGARISLLVGLVGAAVSLVIGVLWGAVSGYSGGRVDSVMMRLVDILFSMPTVVFVIVLVTALNAKLEKMASRPARTFGCKRPFAANGRAVYRPGGRLVADHGPDRPRASHLVAPPSVHRRQLGAGREPRPDHLAPHSAECATASSSYI